MFDGECIPYVVEGKVRGELSRFETLIPEENDRNHNRRVCGYIYYTK